MKPETRTGPPDEHWMINCVMNIKWKIVWITKPEQVHRLELPTEIICWNRSTWTPHQSLIPSTGQHLNKLKKNIEINSFQLLNQLTWTDSFKHCINIAELAQLYDRTTKSLHLHYIPSPFVVVNRSYPHPLLLCTLIEQSIYFFVVLKVLPANVA